MPKQKSRLAHLHIRQADMARIFNRVFSVIEDELEPAASAAALLTLDYTATGVPDGQFKSVVGLGLFYLDRSSTATADGATVLATGQTTGRWLKSSGPAPVANATALAAQSANSPSGTLTYISTFRDFFYWDSTSTLTGNGTEVITPSSNPATGRWLRAGISHPSWAAQSLWYVDPVGGSDENTGVAIGVPLKTFRELHLRLRNQRVGQDTIVWVLNDAPNTDPIILDFQLTANLFQVRGVRTVTRTGTVTASAFPTGGASHVYASVTDSGIASTWTSEVNSMIMQIGSNLVSWIESDQGSKKARIAYPVGTTVGAGYSFVLNQFTVAASYQIVSLPKVTVGHVNIRTAGGSDTLYPRVTIDGLRVASFISTETRSVSFPTYFYECRFDTQVFCDDFDYLNCLFIGGIAFRGSRRQAIVGGLSRALIDCLGSSPQILGFLSVGGQILVSQGGSPLMANIGIFGVTGDALVVQRASYATMLNAVGGVFYGNGNTGYGLSVTGGSTIGVGGSLTCTGTSGDFRVAGSNSVRSLSPTTGAVIGPTSTTWTNFTTAAPTGFGNIVQDLASGCRITPTS